MDFFSARQYRYNWCHSSTSLNQVRMTSLILCFSILTKCFVIAVAFVNAYYEVSLSLCLLVTLLQRQVVCSINVYKILLGFNSHGFTLVDDMGSPMFSQPTVSIKQSFNSSRKYLSPLIALVWLPCFIFILPSHTKTFAWLRQRKNKAPL